VTRAKSGFFPQDEQWGITQSVYSVGCAKQMVWLSGLLPFEQCAEVFERIGGRLIPASSIWRQTQHYGERLQAQAEHERTQVKPERVQVGDAAHDHHRRKGISIDGGMVNIRGEGWKEMKAGAVFEVDLRLARDPRTGELSDYAHGVKVTYAAVLGPVAEFAPALWALAVAHDLPTAAESSVTADGADWIWNLVPDYFPDSVQIVDWYHASQHLAQAAHALHPDDDAQAHAWYHHRLDDLFAGLIDRITRPLDQAGLADQSRYFHVHQRRMQYQEFRENGYPIGSGTIESGIKQFKARLSAAGMRWSRPGADRMLILRAAVLGHDFDRLWRRAA
jgi:hypothetical protein